MVKIFKSFLLMLGYMLSVIVGWFLIACICYMSIRFLKTEHYQSQFFQDTVTPNQKFQVVILDDKHEPTPVYLNKFNNQPLVTSVNDFPRGEDFMRKEGEVYLYHNEGALWNTESRYKIVNNQIQPVSFVFMTFFEAFEALFLSFIGYALVKYLALRFWYRKSQDKVRDLNQTTFKRFKGFLIFITLMVGFYSVIFFITKF
ncbi:MULTISPECIES: hypothetical protein [unclassified Moraxella]|uniref:hypothetical protein n=1 Tax=unclassified Moraxella TaxID=2685852 RepID=UPI003AF9514C